MNIHTAEWPQPEATAMAWQVLLVSHEICLWFSLALQWQMSLARALAFKSLFHLWRKGQNMEKKEERRNANRQVNGAAVHLASNCFWRDSLSPCPLTPPSLGRACLLQSIRFSCDTLKYKHIVLKKVENPSSNWEREWLLLGDFTFYWFWVSSGQMVIK